MTMNFKTISNGEAISIESIPQLSFDEFSTQALAIVSGGGKVVQFFAFQVDDTIRLDGCLAHRRTACRRLRRPGDATLP